MMSHRKTDPIHPAWKGRERRQNERFSVKEGALAFLGTTPGAIVDISNTGIAVHYVVFERELAHTLELDIFFPENDFYLPGLPLQVVSERLVSGSFLAMVEINRLGIQFGEMTKQQREKLQLFIHHNTISSA